MLMIAEKTTDNNTAERQAFRQALAAVVIDAKAALPQSSGRVEMGERLLLTGDVVLLPDGSAHVGSRSREGTIYHVLPGPKCPCPDAAYRTELHGFCQHALARALLIATNRRLARHLTTPVPEETLMVNTTETDTTQTPETTHTPTPHGIPAQFMVTLHGKPFVTYPGLLAMAHARGIKSISAHFISVTADLALAEATVEFDDGRIFMECADATPKNVSPKIAAHFPRLALTRSKCRALRDALNVGMCALEELDAD